MFEDLIKETKYHLCIGCSTKIKEGEACPTCNFAPQFYYAPYIPMAVIDCNGNTLEDNEVQKAIQGAFHHNDGPNTRI